MVRKNWKKSCSYLLLLWSRSKNLKFPALLNGEKKKFSRKIPFCSYLRKQARHDGGSIFWSKFFLDRVYFLTLESFKKLSGTYSTSLPCHILSQLNFSFWNMQWEISVTLIFALRLSHHASYSLIDHLNISRSQLLTNNSNGAPMEKAYRSHLSTRPKTHFL